MLWAEADRGRQRWRVRVGATQQESPLLLLALVPSGREPGEAKMLQHKATRLVPLIPGSALAFLPYCLIYLFISLRYLERNPLNEEGPG